MGFNAIVVIVVLIAVLILLYKEYLGPAFTFLIAIVIFGLFGILEPSEMLHGFANEQIAIILMLLLIGDIIRRTAIIEIIFDNIFRSDLGYKGFMGRMIFLVSGFSAFLNNTPIVAVMMPYVHNWSKRHNISPSKLLIPLSYAAILGGCCTLIGTSTNLIVNGLLVDQTIVPEKYSLNLFDFSLIGGVMVVVGFLYLILFSGKLLPNKEDLISDFSADARKYVVEAIVRENGALIGKTIEEAGFRNLKGLFLVEIIRHNFKIKAVSPHVELMAGDVLVFAGDTKTIAELINTNGGLMLAEVGMFTRKQHTEVLEVVVSHNSSIIDKTVKDARFRGKYDAAIIGVHRNGERISGKIGEVKLKAGDVLLLIAGDSFPTRSNETQDFYLISKVREIHKFKPYKLTILFGGIALAILLSALGIVSLFMALIVLLIILLSIKLMSYKDLAKTIDFNLAVIIALSLAFGLAMIKTGVAQYIADVMVKSLIPLGIYGIMFGLFFITSILAAYITNKAAVAIIFPISMTVAHQLGENPIPFVLLTSFAGAANFMTPIGYQTNLMVYGPGRYSFKDFFKIGFPLTMIYMVVTVLLLIMIYDLH